MTQDLTVLPVMTSSAINVLKITRAVRNVKKLLSLVWTETLKDVYLVDKRNVPIVKNTMTTVSNVKKEKVSLC